MMDISTRIRREGFEDQRLYRVPPAVYQRMTKRPHLKEYLVSDIGYFPHTEGHEVRRPGGIKCYILILVEAGSGWLAIGNRRWNVRRGEAILIPPGEPHAYGSSIKSPWKIYWFHFKGKGATELLSWSNFSRKTPVLSCTAADTLKRQFRTALNTVEGGYSDHTLLELSRLLINVLTHLHTRTSGKSQRQNRRVSRIEQTMEYMRENVDRPQPLAHYARLSGRSVSSFSEAFRTHCGVSPMTYFTELRIQRACELLDNTELRIGEIAQRLGFNDSLYFSRLFARHAGMPPTAYRKLP